MSFESEVTQVSFDAIRLRLASPDQIRSWSYGEVLKPETINYRTQRPERDGLFSERIFGPVKDWECFCGKYKRIRYKGVICDKCGVEVTRAQVRRERFGHIELATPVTHIWFLRGVPSQVGLMLDLSVQELERVVYFADFIVTRVNEDLRKETFVQIQEEFKAKKRTIESEHKKGSPTSDKDTVLSIRKEERLKELQEAFQIAKRELAELKVLQIISESEYQDLSLKYGHIFEASIGAEAVYQILSELDLGVVEKQFVSELEEANGIRKKKIMKRLKLVRSFIKNHLRPEWMIIKTLPVLPPDLRPMVQLDGGRFATSDLNDLYRRVINRNNRLKRLLELNAPEVICRNEKRMLQEAVDALIDNTARHGKTVTASTGQKRMLKSLADTLKGKQGRFRQNLLGKRVDYSGRSVIVVGPELHLHECGLPKRMALELFKPFVIAKLIERQLVHNVRSANRFIETGVAEVWDILEEVTANTAVLLNRAPTLHRLGIQAFKPVLIEGKAIQIHPMVCPAFNADFDGDQMAVHVPLTEEARAEAMDLMLSSKNILLPSQGTPVTMPAQEIILGIYYLTALNSKVHAGVYANGEDAILTYKDGRLGLQDRITVRQDGERMVTTAGRLIFNRLLPRGVGFINEPLTKKGIQLVIAKVIKLFGIAETARLLDVIKEVSYEYVTQSGMSIGLWDLPTLHEKPALMQEAEAQVDEIVALYEQGLLTKAERKIKSIEIWQRMKDKVQLSTQRIVDPTSSVGAMVTSGARGQWAQVTQMIGMKGSVVNPQNEAIELPIKSSFKEGFKVIEYFIASHGTRKGMADTALRTANAGYLTRRLVDVAQDITVVETDCQDREGYEILKNDLADIGISLAKQLEGRFLLSPLTLSEGIVTTDEPITEEQSVAIERAGIEHVKIRSVFACKTRRGVCQRCYGIDLGYGKLAAFGTAVGIIAAQSIGEPGTQLTLRTFHSGGVAGAQDVTTGLPRVDELFEARPVKKPALLAPIAGEVKIGETQVSVAGRMSKQKVIQVRGIAVVREQVRIEEAALDQLLVKDGQEVSKGDTILEAHNEKLIAPLSGTCTIESKDDAYMIVFIERTPSVKELVVPQGYAVLVKDGQEVTVGDQLTEGPVNVAELFEMKGVRAAQKYMMREVLYVYTSQGHPLNTKHLEIILRQIFSRVSIEDPGDTDLTIGDTLELAEVLDENERVLALKKRVAVVAPRFMGITKASLSTSSFLSAASFQETSKVLIQAAVSGKVDHLRGLKENVIIGKLIPAGTGLKSHQKSE